MGPLIDLALHIALPLHTALARRLLRDFLPESGAIDDAGADELRKYITMHRMVGGTIYELIDQLAETSSDVVLDGLLDSESLLERALVEASGPVDGYFAGLDGESDRSLWCQVEVGD
jgi:hypothetical protein